MHKERLTAFVKCPSTLPKHPTPHVGISVGIAQEAHADGIIGNTGLRRPSAEFPLPGPEKSPIWRPWRWHLPQGGVDGLGIHAGPILEQELQSRVVLELGTWVTEELTTKLWQMLKGEMMLMPSRFRATPSGNKPEQGFKGTMVETQGQLKLSE